MVQLLTAIPVLLLGAIASLASRTSRPAAAASLVSQTIGCALVLGAALPILARGHGEEFVWEGPRIVGVVPFRLDALGAFFLSWSLPMTLLGTVYARGYLEPSLRSGRSGGSHFALLNVTALSFVLIYTTQSALVFLLGWEVAATAAWLLVIWDYPNQKIRFAGFNYLVSTHVGLFVLVAALMHLHARTGSMDFATFREPLAGPGPTRVVAFLLLGCSFAIKSAYFPFHTWLPRAHSAAPAHVSALMSGVIHKAGLFGFLRFLLLSGRPDEWMGWTVLGFGLLSAFFGAIYSVPQRDVKRLLGYSSTENVGIMAIGFGAGCLGWTWGKPGLAVLGFAGGLLHLFNHAVFKCLLFYAAGSIYRATHTVDVERLGGLARRLPFTTSLFLIGALAISALPPLNGFVSELAIYAALFSGHAPGARENAAFVATAALLAFVGAVSTFSMTRAFGVTFLGRARDGDVHVGAESPVSMLGPMTVHAAGVLAVGLVPQLGWWLVRPVVALLPVATDAGTDALVAAVGTGTRALTLLLGSALGLAWMAGRRSTVGETWGCGDPRTTARMQYTGTSFAEHFARVFTLFLPTLRREHVLDQTFPRTPGNIATHHVDLVERRLFEVIGRGEQLVVAAADRVPQDPRLAFAAGLAALVVIGGLIRGGLAP